MSSWKYKNIHIRKRKMSRISALEDFQELEESYFLSNCFWKRRKKSQAFHWYPWTGSQVWLSYLHPVGPRDKGLCFQPTPSAQASVLPVTFTPDLDVLIPLLCSSFSTYPCYGLPPPKFMSKFNPQCKIWRGGIRWIF
jgi:hypothetical protein